MGTVTKTWGGDQHTTAHPSPFPRVLIHLIMWGLPLVVLVAVTTMSASTSVNSIPSNSEVVASEVSIPSNSSKPDLTQEVVAYEDAPSNSNINIALDSTNSTSYQ